MFYLNVSEEDVKYLSKLIDLDLRTNGLNSLGSAVKLHNSLLTLKPVEEPEVDKPKKSTKPADKGA